MGIRRQAVLVAALGALSAVSMSVQAQEAGDWKFRVGAGMVDPKSDNGDIASVDSGTSLVFNGTYFLSDTWAVELLASLPFSHDIELAADGTRVGETKHLPPTLSIQYMFPTGGPFKPYAGLGLNYTLFFDEETTGPLEGLDLDLDGSFGVAAQLGFDYEISERMFVNLDVRWINIETDARLENAPLETVEIDPLVYSLTVGWNL
jgi:outer membrane protein